jgi:glycosyltransferase involved in cell wall biosynthesis
LLHVAQISFFTDPQGRAPDELLRAWPSLVDVAEAVSSSGARVAVIQACHHSRTLVRNGVSYHFLPFGAGASAAGAGQAFAQLLRELAPEVLHVHGLDFPQDVLSLAALAPGTPIALQDHASRPPRLWRRALRRRGFAVASGVAFCSREQARPFASAGLIQPQTQIYEIPESTSRFEPGDKEAARRATGSRGDPLVLWVGHLNANKDPLTVLEGVSQAARTLPALQLWCCFAAAPLLRDVEQRIASDPILRGRTHLLGRVSHATVGHLMRAADIFVLGSHREGSGYSLIEALACGLPPVVTDIPSFRSLTGAAEVGMLWPCGDAPKLCAALLAIAARPQPQTRAAVRAHFERELSFEAVGLKLSSMYEDLLRRNRMQRLHC